MQDESGQPQQQGNEPDWEALARHIAAESDPVEASSVQAWLAAHQSDAAFVVAMRDRLTHADAVSPIAVNVEAALRSVQSRLDADVVFKAPVLTVSRGGAARVAEPRVASVRSSRARWGSARTACR